MNRAHILTISKTIIGRTFKNVRIMRTTNRVKATEPRVIVNADEEAKRLQTRLQEALPEYKVRLHATSIQGQGSENPGAIIDVVYEFTEK